MNTEHWTAITTAQVKNVVDLYFSRCHTASHRVDFGKANESCRRSMFTSANGNRGCGLTFNRFINFTQRNSGRYFSSVRVAHTMRMGPVRRFDNLCRVSECANRFFSRFICLAIHFTTGFSTSIYTGRTRWEEELIPTQSPCNRSKCFVELSLTSGSTDLLKYGKE